MIPPTKGGTVHMCNKVPCCGSCNSSKGNRVGLDFELWLVQRGSRPNDVVGISAERAISIVEYMDAHRNVLEFTGPALDAFHKQYKHVRGIGDEYDLEVSHAFGEIAD